MRALVIPATIVLLLVSCSSPDEREQPPPTTVRLSASDKLQEGALSALIDLATPLGIAVELSEPHLADIVIDGEASEGGIPFITRYWVPVVAPSSTTASVSVDELRVAFFSTDRPGGGPPDGVIPTDPPPPLEQLWPGATPTAHRATAAQAIENVASGAAAIGLLPLGSVDPRVRSVAVNGINIVFGEGDVASYPLVERAWVRAVPHEDEAFSSTLEMLARQLASRLSAPPPDPIILRATGDVLPVRCTLARIQDLDGDFRRPFSELGPWLAEADLTVSSLDAAVSDAGTPFGCQETLSLLAPATAVDGFEFAGIDVMTVATNHAKDCGTSSCGDQSFLETLQNLRARSIQPVGGGENLAAARQPAIVESNGIKFAFLGYDEIAPYYHAEAAIAGTAPLRVDYLRDDVGAAAQQADVVVVMPHWGVEYTADPNDNQRAFARAAIAAGAELVLGNHPHWVQAAEVIDGSFVAYALGNFVFDQDWSLETQQGAMLEAAFHGPRLAGIRYYPVRIVDNHQPQFAKPDEAQQILDRIWNASAALD